MCNKWGAGFIGVERSGLKKEKPPASCGFNEDLAGLSETEEMTSFGHIRIKNISFVEVFKNLWKNF